VRGDAAALAHGRRCPKHHRGAGATGCGEGRPGGFCVAQRVRDVPLLPLSNCFAALSIVPDNEDTIHVSETGSDTVTHQPPRCQDWFIKGRLHMLVNKDVRTQQTPKALCK
jgi:hypothetical protein